MKKIYFLIMLVFAGGVLLPAQTEMTQATRDALNYGTFNLNPIRSAIYGVEGSKGSIQGDIYLDSAWHVAEIFFYPEVVRRYDPNASDSIGGYPVRVEVVDYSVEFKVKEVSKSVEESAIRKLSWNKGNQQITLVNTRQYPGAKDVSGFFQVIAEGSLTILKYTKINLLQPTYNVALDVGTKDYRIIKKEEYYYLRGGKENGKLEKFKPTKSALLELMRNKKSGVAKYMEENDLNLRKDEDLAKLVAFYNE